jgi:hypothetical protein
MPGSFLAICFAMLPILGIAQACQARSKVECDPTIYVKIKSKEGAIVCVSRALFMGQAPAFKE